MKAALAVKKAVLKTVGDAMKAYITGDAQQAMPFYANDKDVVVIGSDKKEIFKGPAQLKKAFSATVKPFSKLTYKAKPYEVSACGNVAWVSGAGVYDGMAGGKKFRMDGRFSCVLEKRAGKWLIVHLHYSVPAN